MSSYGKYEMTGIEESSRISVITKFRTHSPFTKNNTYFTEYCTSTTTTTKYCTSTYSLYLFASLVQTKTKVLVATWIA